MYERRSGGGASRGDDAAQLLPVRQLLPSRGGAYRSLRSRAGQISGMRRCRLSAPCRPLLPKTHPLLGCPRSGSRTRSRRPVGDALCRPQRCPGHGPTGGSRLWRRQLSSHNCDCPRVRTRMRVQIERDADGGRRASPGAAQLQASECRKSRHSVQVKQPDTPADETSEWWPPRAGWDHSTHARDARPGVSQCPPPSPTCTLLRSPHGLRTPCRQLRLLPSP